MGKPGRDRALSPMNLGDSATMQEVCHEGPPTRSRWGRYYLARPGGRPGPKSAQYPQNQTSNLKPHLVIFIIFFEAVSLFLKATRVLALAPHEAHPYQ